METNTQLPKKFGKYGGQFVPEVLMPALEELEKAYVRAQQDQAFQSELQHLLATYVGPLAHIVTARKSI